MKLPNRQTVEAFQLPEKQDKADYVRRLFASIASHYDLLNDLMSLGLHRRWKQMVVDQSGLLTGGSALDICCGTGDITLALARRAGRAGKVVGLDFSPEMLAIARERYERHPPPGSVQFQLGDAQALPFMDESFDCVTVSYGLRNLADIPAGLREMRRIVRPGGRMVCLDLGKPRGAVWSRLYRIYFLGIVPHVGGWISGQRWAYTYLPHSLADFPAQEGLKALMAETGWQDIRCLDLFGGIAAIHIGTKPEP